ncbi:batA protein [Vibrio ishigakensis]|uniref:BatA protein n=1 Tax=Vibrio ishigakensis TaxID=1481914 RepID=A0A0B8NZ86_9VIBR|nr:VWA domain-containing protein [Vibrio ishigakensis]GAM59271.1 batA protein [Vibrio ishigakensis]
MIEFEYPWMAILLLLPYVVYRFSPAYKESKSSLQVPFFTRLVEVSGEQPTKSAAELNRRRLQWIIVVVSYLSLVAALMKPMWVGEPIEQRKSAREIMVALDLSGSMSERDFVDDEGNKQDRLTVAKQVLKEFGAKRKDDRLGLILFADAPYVQAPFTEDTNTWLNLLSDVELGYAGFQTAFGDAIGLSISVFEQEQSRQRVMILLTDGDDTSSKMPPIKAAEIAAKYGVKIYTIAMGDPSTEGRYKMDIPTLEKVSELTGGQTFQALNRQDLEQAYKTIDELEEQEFEVLSHRPKHSLHHYAFGIGFVLNLVTVLLLLLGNLKFIGGRKWVK